MNTQIAEREPRVNTAVSADKIDLLQVLAVQLSDIHEDRIAEEAPIPDDVQLEIMATFAEEGIEGEENTSPTNNQNGNEDKQRERVFLRAGSDNIEQATVVRDSAKVGENFRTSVDCPIGRNSVIGNDCSIVSPVGRRVHIGNDAVILKGCTLGATDLKKWGYYEKVKNVEGETVKEWIEYETHIGNRIYMAKGSKIRPYSTVGDDVTMGTGSEIGKSVAKIKRDGHIVENQKSPKKPTFIGNGCVIGKGAIIEAGARIGSGYWIADKVIVPETVKLPDNESDKEIVIDQRFLDRYLFEQRKANIEKTKAKA